MWAANGRSNYGPIWAWTGPEPLHKTTCDSRPCRPGEGNLRGYAQWKMPFTDDPIPANLSKFIDGWTAKQPEFPTARYASLISAAMRVQHDGMVVLTAADFDYRIMALNWHRAASLAGMTNSLVLALDSEAFSFFLERRVPTVNGTVGMEAWKRTRLMRHIQRALAERHMAAVALATSGLDVLLVDTTAVFHHDPGPLLRVLSAGLDLMVMRDGCNARKHPSVGCTLLWNFVFLRGHAPMRARMVDFVRLSWRAAIALPLGFAFCRGT